jgi:hypothetical protein
MKELEIKERELELEGIRTGQDITVALAKIEGEKLQAAAQLEEQELRYQAETERTKSDLSIAHAENLVKLLTHKSKEPKYVR